MIGAAMSSETVAGSAAGNEGDTVSFGPIYSLRPAAVS